MPSAIPIPRISLGKRKERSQMSELLTSDGRWLDKEYPAEYRSVVDEEGGSVYLIDEENQYLNEESYWVQLMVETSSLPLPLKTGKSLGSDDEEKVKDKLELLGDDLFQLSSKRKTSELFEKMGKDEMWHKIMWLISIPCGTFLIIAAFRYIPMLFGKGG